MSFFLSSKPAPKFSRAKTVVPDKTKKQTKDTAEAPLYNWVWLWLLLGMVLFVSLGAGWFFARKALRQDLALRSPVPTDANAIRMEAFKNAPWVSVEETNLRKKDMAACLSSDPLDGKSLAAAASVLEAHPAIKKVLKIYRDDKGQVQVKASVYQPVGLVVIGETLSAIDDQGHLLAEHLVPATVEKVPVPRIEGIHSIAPSGGKDVIWKDANLKAATDLILHLAEANLSNDNRLLHTVAVNSENTGKISRISLTLFLRFSPTQTLEVLWGLPLGEEAGVDAAALAKLRALRDLCKKPAVRNGSAGTRFSIRSGNAVALPAK